jgi:hypothetical protein
MFAFIKDAFAKRLKGERPGALRALLVALLISIAAAVIAYKLMRTRAYEPRSTVRRRRPHLSHDRPGQGRGKEGVGGHGCRSEAGADRALAHGRSSSLASALVPRSQTPPSRQQPPSAVVSPGRHCWVEWEVRAGAAGHEAPFLRWDNGRTSAMGRLVEDRGRMGPSLSARSRPPTCPRRGRAPCHRGRSRSHPWCRSWRSAPSRHRRRPRPGSPGGRPAAGRRPRRNSR